VWPTQLSIISKKMFLVQCIHHQEKQNINKRIEKRILIERDEDA